MIFDVGHGGGSFAWRVAAAAIKEGFLPDSISTDLHITSMNSGMKDMLNVMSKFLALGMSVDDVIVRSTWNPAREIHHDELGNLAVGAPADVAVLRVERGTFGFTDMYGARMNGNQKFDCEMTVKGGKVVYDLNGISRPDWTTLPKDYKTSAIRDGMGSTRGEQRALKPNASMLSRLSEISRQQLSNSTSCSRFATIFLRPAAASRLRPRSCSRLNRGPRAVLLPVSGFSSILGVPLRSSVGHFARRDLHLLPGRSEAAGGERGSRRRDLSRFALEGGNVLGVGGNGIRPAAKLRFASFIGLAEEPVHGRDHADDLLLRHLHPAAHRLRVRIVVRRQRLRSGSFRPAAGPRSAVRGFPCRRRTYQVEAHLRVVPEVRNRRNVGGRVVEARHVVCVRDANPLLAADLAALGGVEEVRHHRFAPLKAASYSPRVSTSTN